MYMEHYEQDKILSTLDDCKVRNDQIIKKIRNNWLLLFSPMGKGINNNQQLLIYNVNNNNNNIEL